MKNIVITLIVGALGGAIAAMAIPNIIQTTPTQEEFIKDFYNVETAVHVSPHGLRKHITDLGESKILVDLRSQEEYETEHIIGAINIPAYSSPDKSAYGDVERIVGAFAELPQDKEIIVYCYSMPCMTGRKIGHMLTEHDIYVKHLGIGWQEWRYYWNLWNHDGETKVNPADYVYSGPEPGVFEGEGGSACPIGGDFGC
tara:strand:- start:250 stop:846 length:597 start_codon:yes stop_codon:yes gene_type:complete